MTEESTQSAHGRAGVPIEALAEREHRRVERLLRQLQLRSAEADGLMEAVEALRAENEALRAKAEQLDALMRTKTMRSLAIPRRLYSDLLKRTPPTAAR